MAALVILRQATWFSGASETADWRLATVLTRFEQYEVWELNQGKWELIAAFRDFEIANVLAHRRTYRVRLMHVVYEGNKAVQQDVLTEIGATRQDE